jgi:anti-anti-sigma factor
MTENTVSFTAQTQMEGGTAIIDLHGEINSMADAAMEAACTAAMVESPEKIVLDFTAVDYINSTGIALIIGVLAQARTARIPLSATGLSNHYREIFAITRLSDFIEIQ